MTTKRIPLEVDEQTHLDIKVQSAKNGTTVADILRALLRAFLKGDPRAKQIVKEYSDKK
jgi:plasmid stability protein